jgi:glyoxylase-like metal-dependent hydrolase (beta-lactamase superfamily II)
MCPAGGTLVGGGRGQAPGLLVCHVLLVETERDGLLLVDTGFGRAQCAEPARVPRLFRALARPRLDPAHTAAAQVTALGYRIEDVRHVVITHLDLDHAGGLADFPHAAVHLHRHEYRAAMRRDSLRARARYLPAQWRHGPRWVTYLPTGETWLGLPAVRPLAGVRAEIALVPLLGHSAGHTGVALRRGDGWLLHAGDAIFHAGELTAGAPVPAGLRALAALDEHDRAARHASREALRQLARRDDVTIVCSHDPAQLAAARAVVPSARDGARRGA